MRETKNALKAAIIVSDLVNIFGFVMMYIQWEFLESSPKIMYRIFHNILFYFGKIFLGEISYSQNLVLLGDLLFQKLYLG